MRILQKQVSLEPMTSRLPGLYPAYKDGELYFFDDEHLKARGYEFPTNWGMIPVMLRLNYTPGPAYNCDNYIVSCDGPFTMSWERMSKWYGFFTEYYSLLNDYGHCGISYRSAIDYYNNESRTKYSNQMKYGLEKETYENMDEIFNNIGGKIQLTAICTKSDSDLKFTKENVYKYSGQYIVINDENEEKTVDEAYFKSHFCQDKTIDKGFYCWLRKNIVKTSDTVTGNVETVNSTIKAQFDECSVTWNTDCFIPTIDDNINLQVSIDDIGEFSIFCTEYELGQSVTTSGDVMYMDGNTYILTGGTGYVYDEVYKEMVINMSDWADYMDVYINEKDPETGEYVNRRYFDTDYDYYGFRSDGTKVTADSEEAVKNELKTTYPIVEKAGVLINGDIIPINKEEYVEYNSKKYYVFREKDTETPYTFINGKKVYATLNTNNVTKICYKFSFADKIFGRTRTTESTLEEYVSYNGCNYTFNASGNIEIDGIEYYKVDGYFYANHETLYYKTVGSTTTVYRWYAMEMQTVSGYERGKINESGEWVSDSNGNLFKKKDENPVVYKTGEITGYTTSKLKLLESTDKVIDSAGNMLPGRYEYKDFSGKTYSQPLEGTELDLLYEVGNTANIMPYKKTQTLDQLIDIYNENKDKNWFIGDIITRMNFYYKGIDGKKYVGDTEGTKNWTTSSLDTIKSVGKPTKMLLESENIFCDITYLIGATLERTANNKFSVYTDGNSGVTYNETVEFEKKNVEYHLKAENSKSTPMEKKGAGVHSLSYPVVCYVIKKQEVEIDGEIKYVDNTAKFSSDSFKCQSGTVRTYENDNVVSETGIFPILRREYMFGSAIIQNVDANIYIDRGINAALDKHLKLGEVTSMEALENYSNGYFKMMNN